MERVRIFRLAVVVAVVLTTAPLVGQKPSRGRLSAPTYYIAAEVVGCEPNPNSIEFRGATNLPPGALMTAVVSDFDSDSWKTYSNETHVSVSPQGFFAGVLSPKKGMQFHRNLLLQVYFAPSHGLQPADVLEIVGSKGEKLQDVANVQVETSKGLERPAVNPQLIQWSGEVHGLWTIARVPNCGEK